jgi:hypothetical protein
MIKKEPINKFLVEVGKCMTSSAAIGKMNLTKGGEGIGKPIPETYNRHFGIYRK